MKKTFNLTLLKKRRKNMKKKTFYFTLKIEDEIETEQKYGLTVRNENSTDEISNVTQLTDLRRDGKQYTFLNEVKREKTCEITMCDLVSRKELPEKTEINCFWCRFPFASKPIGCPLKYIPNYLLNEYKSVITDDNYSIRENVSHYKKSNVKEDVKMHDKGYFETDGIFCSFNCVLSFIKDSKKQPIYNFSESLLNLMYFLLFNSEEKIMPAPNWRQLKTYGGYLSIDEYRENFYNVNYNYTGTISKIVRNKPIGYIYEKNIKI